MPPTTDLSPQRHEVHFRLARQRRYDRMGGPGSTRRHGVLMGLEDWRTGNAVTCPPPALSAQNYLAHPATA